MSISVSSGLVLIAAAMFAMAAIAAAGEDKPAALWFAYLMLAFANVGFSQLDV